MDPISATSLAAAIVQLADFTTKVLSRSQELYKSTRGALIQHEELQCVTDMFSKMLAEIGTGQDAEYRSSDKHMSGLGTVVAEAQKTTNELLHLLSQLTRSPGSSERWKSVRQAVLTVWRDDKLRDLEKRVDRYRNQVSLALMNDLRYVWSDKGIAECLFDCAGTMSRKCRLSTKRSLKTYMTTLTSLRRA
jgi:hypothetical protein